MTPEVETEAINPKALDDSPAGILLRLKQIRPATEAPTKDPAPEDFAVQSMGDVSPIECHLIQKSWFWEAFGLSKWMPIDLRTSTAYLDL